MTSRMFLNAQVYAANNARALQIMDRAGWK
jgi:hypothetical protein